MGNITANDSAFDEVKGKVNIVAYIEDHKDLRDDTEIISLLKEKSKISDTWNKVVKRIKDLKPEISYKFYNFA
ncbi:MAG: hypothetical protein WCO35_01725 [Candidatus Nomurabacteria bacterium]